MAAVVLGGFVAPASASALIDFTWTGAAGTPVWSNGGNWSGGTAPSGSVGTLTFPAISSCDQCAAYGPSDDIAGLSANALAIDDSAQYYIGGSQSLTLGAGGITAAPTAHAGAWAELQPGVVLGALQKWTIAGDGAGTTAGVDFFGKIAGASYPLTVDLSNGAQLRMQDVETGALTITGSGALTAAVATSLNATDGNPVSVNNGASLLAYGGGDTVGPLHVSGGAISLLGDFGGPPLSAGTLAVKGGLGLDAASSVTMDIGYIGEVGIGGFIDDIPEITATGPVDLGTASLTLASAEGCGIFSPGQTYTLITTTGSLTGEFAGIPDGATVTLSSSCPTQTMRINYTANSVIATVVNPGPAPTNIGVTTDPATAVTNQPVTLTATVTADYGTPAGNVSFENQEGPTGPIAGCGRQPVRAQGSSGTATCKTSFTAAAGSCCSGNQYLRVGYTPSDSSTRGSSNTCCFDLVFGSILVGPARTTTAVTASSPSVVTGRSVTYTATVTPAYLGSAAPTGSIAFAANGDAISSCAKQPVGAVDGSATAACTVTYPTTGTHAITARYTGDGNFNGSTSGSARVTIWSLRALAAQLRPSGKAAAIRVLLRHGKLTQHIAAATAGTLTIRWYATTVHRNHPHYTLLATGRTTYRGAGTKTVPVTLTSTGRAILTHARRIRITGSATFTTTGAPPATVTLTFVLKR